MTYLSRHNSWHRIMNDQQLFTRNYLEDITTFTKSCYYWVYPLVDNNSLDINISGDNLQDFKKITNTYIVIRNFTVSRNIILNFNDLGSNGIIPSAGSILPTTNLVIPGRTIFKFAVTKESNTNWGIQLIEKLSGEYSL